MMMFVFHSRLTDETLKGLTSPKTETQDGLSIVFCIRFLKLSRKNVPTLPGRRAQI